MLTNKAETFFILVEYFVSGYWLCKDQNYEKQIKKALKKI